VQTSQASSSEQQEEKHEKKGGNKTKNQLAHINVIEHQQRLVTAGAGSHSTVCICATTLKALQKILECSLFKALAPSVSLKALASTMGFFLKPYGFK
jgi:hydrogenase maturation factor